MMVSTSSQPTSRYAAAQTHIVQEAFGPVTILCAASEGAGVTLATIGIAARLARKARVLVIDLGTGNGQCARYLRATVVCGLTECLSGKISADEAITPIDGGAGKGGFDLMSLNLSGNRGMDGPDPFEAAAMNGLIMAMAFDYDHVLIDSGPWSEALKLRLIAAADSVILLTSPETLTQTYGLIKQTIVRRRDANIAILANRLRAPNDAKKISGALQNAAQTHLELELKHAGAVMENLSTAMKTPSAKANPFDGQTLQTALALFS